MLAHRNARLRSASHGCPALAFAPGPRAAVRTPSQQPVHTHAHNTVPRPCGPAHLGTGQVAIAREPPFVPVTRAGRCTSKPPLPGSWTHQLVPRANETFLGSPPPRTPLLIRKQNKQQSRMTFSSVPSSSMVATVASLHPNSISAVTFALYAFPRPSQANLRRPCTTRSRRHRQIDATTCAPRPPCRWHPARTPPAEDPPPNRSYSFPETSCIPRPHHCPAIWPPPPASRAQAVATPCAHRGGVAGCPAGRTGHTRSTR
jgi:hypothetical protein